ncbi:hypothetical protein CGRA01v4_06183 [Colletotrichum graminicola]|nr:hypothetical protein CGRA01v4_06183 [Colletotrichum graminicola]
MITRLTFSPRSESYLCAGASLGLKLSSHLRFPGYFFLLICSQPCRYPSRVPPAIFWGWPHLTTTTMTWRSRLLQTWIPIRTGGKLSSAS